MINILLALEQIECELRGIDYADLTTAERNILKIVKKIKNEEKEFVDNIGVRKLVGAGI